MSPNSKSTLSLPGAYHVLSNSITLESRNAGEEDQPVINPEVKWHPEHRKPDKPGRKACFGLFFKALYVVFIASSIAILTLARPKYERSPDHSNIIVSSHLRDNAEQCCTSIQEDGEVELEDGGLCARPEISTDALGGWTGDTDNANDDDEAWGRKLFVIGAATIMAVAIMLVRSKRKEWANAHQAVSHSLASFKSNPKMFFVLFILLVVFLLHAFLFLSSVTKIFDVAVDVRRQTHARISDDISVVVGSCTFESPSYVTSLWAFQMVYGTFLMVVFDQIRLAVIGMVVGCDHFHPDHKCSVWQAMKIALSTSFGTLVMSGYPTFAFEWLMIMPLIDMPGMPVLAAMLYVICRWPMDTLHAFSKFFVVIHAFTGLRLESTINKTIQMKDRRSEGWFVTNYCVRSALFAVSYIFTILIMATTWMQVDQESFEELTSGGASSVAMLLLQLMAILSYPFFHITQTFCTSMTLRDHNLSVSGGQERTIEQRDWSSYRPARRFCVHVCISLYHW